MILDMYAIVLATDGTVICAIVASLCRYLFRVPPTRLPRCPCAPSPTYFPPGAPFLWRPTSSPCHPRNLDSSASLSALVPPLASASLSMVEIACVRAWPSWSSASLRTKGFDKVCHTGGLWAPPVPGIDSGGAALGSDFGYTYAR